MGLLMAFRGTCDEPVMVEAGGSVWQHRGAAEGWKSRAGCRKVCNKDRSYFGEERKEEEEVLPFARLLLPGLGSVSDGEFLWSVTEQDWRLPSVLTSLRTELLLFSHWCGQLMSDPTAAFSQASTACRRCPRRTAEGSPALCIGSSMGGIMNFCLWFLAHSPRGKGFAIAEDPTAPNQRGLCETLCDPHGSICPSPGR